MRLPRLGVRCMLRRPCGLIRVQGCGEGGIQGLRRLTGQLNPTLITSTAEYLTDSRVVMNPKSGGM